MTTVLAHRLMRDTSLLGRLLRSNLDRRLLPQLLTDRRFTAD
jgi:hypothetical protein